MKIIVGYLLIFPCTLGSIVSLRIDKTIAHIWKLYGLKINAFIESCIIFSFTYLLCMGGNTIKGTIIISKGNS